MARLVAMAKMGYYPTPEELTPTITKYLNRKEQERGVIRIFDPCAGEGTALKTVGEHLQAETYGVEIDRQRGRAARKKLTRCLVTDYKATQISRAFASLLWLNPPYDWAAKTEDIGRSERYELAFLRDTTKYLAPGGVLVYLIPLSRLDGTVAQVLSYRYERVRLYKFPEKIYRQFRQAVLFGTLKKNPSIDDSVCERLKRCGEAAEDTPFLPQEPEFVYEVPPSPSIRKFFFGTSEISPEELEEEIRNQGLDGEIGKLTAPQTMEGKMTSIMPLRHGHLAQLIACGQIRGVVFDKEGRNPLIVKGITRKTVDRKVEVEGDLERHIETDRITITINALNQQGELISIQ